MRKLSRRELAGYVADALMSHTGRAKVVKQLAAYLIETHRTKELDLIIRDVSDILADHGIVNATLTSAFELEAATTAAIERLIAAHTKASKVSLHKVVEPSVLGGIKISLPDSELDQTISHQLTILKTRYKKA